MYQKLVVLSYADDTVIFAKNENDFILSKENCVNCSKLWNLDINIDKSKMLVFGDRPRRDRNSLVQGHIFEFVETFKYLGVFFLKK